MILFFLILHLMVTVFMSYLLWHKHLDADFMMIVPVFFLPFFGICMVLLTARMNEQDRTGRRQMLLESMRKPKSAEETPVESEDNAVIPLEDALILNDAPTKRNAILNVLLEDPKQYIPELNAARKNTDIEVVHYATTAMSELHRDYDLRLQELSKKHEKNPVSIELLNRYISVLSEYLEQGLAEGKILMIQRERLLELLRRRMQFPPLQEEDVELLIRTELDAGMIEKAGEDLARFHPFFSNEDHYALLRLEQLYCSHDAEGLQALIHTLATDGRLHGSALHEKMRFWGKEH